VSEADAGDHREVGAGKEVPLNPDWLKVGVFYNEMKTVTLTRMEVETIAATRFMFGAGRALLLPRCLAEEEK
jgi:hypothetical protein